MRKSPHPEAKRLLVRYKELVPDDQAEFLRALGNDMFQLQVSEVCSNEEEREILLEFAPRASDMKEMLLNPFREVLKAVRAAEKMAAFTIVSGGPGGTIRTLLFFEEDPNTFDTMFSRECEGIVPHELEFSDIVLLDGENARRTLRKTGIPITSWVRYRENEHYWSWEPL